ncbi:hypothetical protein KR074_001579, partial [Drosophila pseudoananassae]
EVIREFQLPGLDPFKVNCWSFQDFGSGWLTVFSKRSYSLKMSRTYEDYERGFGDSFDMFFIGLDRLHRLTNGKTNEVLLWNDAKGKKCSNFVVGDRSEGYRVKSIGSCTGNDLETSPKLGTKFSTFDRDEDGVPGRNLAKEMDFGWWFDPGMRC